MNSCKVSRWGTLLFLSVCAITLAGCGGSERQSIEGVITLDGEVVDVGGVSFIPVSVEVPEGEAASKITGEIIDGRYLIPAEKGPYLGKYKVIVFWDKKTGQTYVDPDSEDVYDKREEGMPEMYRDQEQTTLEVEFIAGKMEYDIEISTSE